MVDDEVGLTVVEVVVWVVVVVVVVNVVLIIAVVVEERVVSVAVRVGPVGEKVLEVGGMTPEEEGELHEPNPT